MDVRIVLRGFAWFAIVLGAYAAVASLHVALTRPWIFEPAWARFVGFAGPAALVALVSTILLPQGQRARPRLWVGHGVGVGYVWLALIARWANLA